MPAILQVCATGSVKICRHGPRCPRTLAATRASSQNCPPRSAAPSWPCASIVTPPLEVRQLQVWFSTAWLYVLCDSWRFQSRAVDLT